jgi:hypothetical protein
VSATLTVVSIVTVITFTFAVKDTPHSSFPPEKVLMLTSAGLISYFIGQNHHIHVLPLHFHLEIFPTILPSLSLRTVVVPLSNLYPLITTLLSYILIQKLEAAGFKVFLGSFLVVFGSILISHWRES